MRGYERIDKKAFGLLLRKYRKTCGQTQDQFAEAIGISSSWVCKAENGKGNLSYDLVIKLTNMMGLDIRDIICEDGADSILDDTIRWTNLKEIAMIKEYIKVCKVCLNELGKSVGNMEHMVDGIEQRGLRRMTRKSAEEYNDRQETT